MTNKTTCTHQDTEAQQLRESMQVWIDHHNKRADDAEAKVERLRDVIERCRGLIKQYPCATDGMNSTECKACDILIECDAELGDK